MSLGPPPVPGLDAPRALAAVAIGAVLLDVREQNEWDAGHAPQALHLPLVHVAASAASLPGGQPILVVCRSGRRSALAVTQLRHAGLDAVNVEGGMLAWLDAGGPVVAAAGMAPAIN